MTETSVHPLTAYGCIVSLKSFGEHITSKVLTPYLKQIATNLKNKEGDLIEVSMSNMS